MKTNGKNCQCCSEITKKHSACLRVAITVWIKNIMKRSKTVSLNCSESLMAIQCTQH